MIFSVLGPRVSVTTLAQSPGRSGKRLSTGRGLATVKDLSREATAGGRRAQQRTCIDSLEGCDPCARGQAPSRLRTHD
jgi:hypothetical protein